MVVIKNGERKVTYENLAFCNQMMMGKSAIGSLFEDPLDRTSQRTDDLILDGVSSIEMDHLGMWESKRSCSMTTFKRRLDELNSTEHVILVVTRANAFVGKEPNETKRSLAELLIALEQLDRIDQSICRGLFEGDAIKDIAKQVGLTTRSVELRRQKIMDLFGFNRPIEIVKSLVRLEENGLLDGWL